VKYVLGDMGLFWEDKRHLTLKYMEWAKEKSREPAGTTGMKATEVQYVYIQYYIYKLLKILKEVGIGYSNYKK